MVIVACVVFSNNRSMAQRTISPRNFETLKNNYRNGVDTTDNGEDITYIQDTGNELTNMRAYGRLPPTAATMSLHL